MNTHRYIYIYIYIRVCMCKCKSTIQIEAFNVRTFNRIGQLQEPTAFAIDHNIDRICVQKHRYLHSEDIKYHNISNEWTFFSTFAWKNSVDAAIECKSMLIGPWAQKSLNSIKISQPRLMVATFNGNLSTTIISCYSLVTKRAISISITSYPPLWVASRNTTF